LVAAWAVFFASIAGSFGWIPPLFGRGSNNWETAFWGIQPTSAFLNPPFGVSLILLMADLLLLDYFLKEKDKRVLPLVIFLSGIMIGFKIYGGIVLLGALGVLGGLRLLKREPGLLLAFFGGLCLTLLVYLPAGSGSTNYLVWKPWWFIQTMIEAPDRLNWPSLELRRQVYVAYHNWRNIIILQTFAFLIFLFGNLGTRFFGFISFAKGVLRKKETDTLLALIALLAFLPPIFFVQKVVPWNSIQFLYYFTFIFSFFAAVSVVSIISKLKQRIIKTVFVLVVVLAAMPSTIETIHWFTAPTPTTFLDKSEIEALRFLKNNSLAKDVLLTYPFEESQQKNYPNPPVPMTYYNSPYVSFFTARRVYLEDQNSARILSYDLLGRLGKEKFFFGTDDPNAARSFLTDNQIIYIYMVDNQAFKLSPERIGVKEIFNNQKVRIYKVI
jgi:hypothetical protein